MQENADLKKEMANKDRTVSSLEAQKTEYEQRLQD